MGLIDIASVIPPMGLQVSLTLDAEVNRQTTTTLADTPYQINGNFVYDMNDGFTIASDVIKYVGTTTRDLKVTFSASLKSDTGASILHIGFFKGGVLYTPKSETGGYEKSSGEALNLKVAFAFEDIATNTEFTPVLWSNSAGAVVTATHITILFEPWGIVI